MLMVFIYLWRGEKQKAREVVNRTRKEAPNEAVVYFVKGAYCTDLMGSIVAHCEAMIAWRVWIRLHM
jgi:hypothetical protein